MTLFQIIYYLIVAFGLFLVLNYFKRLEEKTPSIMIIIPVIYIFFISTLPGIEKDLIYLIIPLEMLIRIYYTKEVIGREELINKEYYIQTYGLAFIISFLLTEILLTKIDTILPTVEEIKIGIWFFIIIFLYKVLNGKISFQLETKEEISFKMKEESIIVRYAKFKNKYFSIINSKDKNWNLLIYAMMIYEDRNHSKFLRNLDKIYYRFTGKQMKMGIMQVETNKEITDEESIKIVLKELSKIQKEMITNKSRKKNSYLEILEKYYQEKTKAKDVLSIYETLNNFEKK